MPLWFRQEIQTLSRALYLRCILASHIESDLILQFKSANLLEQPRRAERISYIAVVQK